MITTYVTLALVNKKANVSGFILFLSLMLSANDAATSLPLVPSLYSGWEVMSAAARGVCRYPR